jgi:ferredoxin
MKRRLIVPCLLVIWGGWALAATPQPRRVPKPEFQSGYEIPAPAWLDAPSTWWDYADMALLALALWLAVRFGIQARSRRALLGVAVGSLAYFGFVRSGCTCAIGAVQPVAAALGDGAFLLPVSALVFFLLPLLVALFRGRSFCAAVCPLGVLQDLVLLRPLKVPDWLNRLLGIIPYAYLGMAILFAATGAAFLICRFDPFVSFFRLGGDLNMILYSAGFLVLATVVARPYCRFLCPYGVLLGWMARFAKRRVSIAPEACIQCRLCEDACPMGAIRPPTPARLPEKRQAGTRRLAWILLLAPLIVAGTGVAVASLYPLLSRAHPDVRLAELILREDAGELSEPTPETTAFRTTRTPTADLVTRALRIQDRFLTGAWLVGVFLGLVVVARLLGWSVWRTRTIYEPDPAACVQCGRCYAYCPHEQVRWLKEPPRREAA